jgi:amino acid transporter
MLSLFLITLLVPATDPRLLNGTTSEDAKASPFVLAITDAGITALPSIINAVIMLAVLSVSSSSICGSSRTLAAPAVQHQAPQILAYTDRIGRPIVSILLTMAVGLIAYTAVLSKEAEKSVFNWLLELSGLSSVFTWLTICLCHIRFRAAWKHNEHSLSELPYLLQPGLIGSYLGVLFNGLAFVAQFWVGFAPEGYASMTNSALVENFFEAYLAAPIIVVTYLGHKVWFRTRWVGVDNINILSGTREMGEELEVLRECDRVEVAGRG